MTGPAEVGAGPAGPAPANPTRTGYLGLGSNLGQRRANLQHAVERLAALGVRAVASSRVYASEPVGLVLDQPEFLNACLRIETALGPEQLLALCQGIERKLGRVATVRHGPRVIDIDILTLGELRIELPQLTIPHRELTRRRFVLAPLRELVGDGVLEPVGALDPIIASLRDPAAVTVQGPPLTV